MNEVVSKKSKSVDKVKAAVPEIHEIKLDKIEILIGRRMLDPKWVEALAQDIAAVGQRTPIEVVHTKTGFRLITGNHRVAACHQNGASTVLAIVKAPDEFASEAEIRLIEISENLMRRELNVLDRAMDVAAWREVYEAAQGAVKPGRKSKKAISVNMTLMQDDEINDLSIKFATNFTEASQSALNLSQPVIFRLLRISTLSGGIRQTLALHPICENQSELLNLVKQPIEKQRPIADLIVSGEAANVAAAIAIIDKVPLAKPLAPFAKISEGFSRLMRSEQDRFFDLHADAIVHWQERRGK